MQLNSKDFVFVSWLIHNMLISVDKSVMKSYTSLIKALKRTSKVLGIR